MKRWARVAQSVKCLNTDWMTGVQYLAEAKDFYSSPRVQTGSGATQSPIQQVPGVLSLGVCGWGVTLTTHSYIVPRSRTSRSCTSSTPTSASMACCSRAALLLMIKRGRKCSLEHQACLHSLSTPVCEMHLYLFIKYKLKTWVWIIFRV
jgi:hypothetical protein